jgi:hypothetical protein
MTSRTHFDPYPYPGGDISTPPPELPWSPRPGSPPGPARNCRPPQAAPTHFFRAPEVAGSPPVLLAVSLQNESI